MSDAGYECDTHEEEELRDSLDLHQLISEHIHVEGDVPPISAEQVIEEIDEMMQVKTTLNNASFFCIILLPLKAWSDKKRLETIRTQDGETIFITASKKFP